MENMDENVVVKKKNTGAVVCVALIVGLLIGLGGAYLFFSINPKLITKTSTSTDIEEKDDNNEKTIEDFKTTSLFVKNLIERYDDYFITNAEIFRDLYSKDETKVTDLNDNLVKYLIAKEANKDLHQARFTEEQFQNAKTILFGKNFTLENGDITGYCNDVIKYNSDSKYYSYVEGSGCGGTTPQSMLRKITKVENKGDTLEVTVAAGIVDAASNKVYVDTNATQEISDIQVLTDLTIADSDYDKLPKFTYHFSYDEENNNYYLTTIKKVAE